MRHSWSYIVHISCASHHSKPQTNPLVQPFPGSPKESTSTKITAPKYDSQMLSAKTEIPEMKEPQSLKPRLFESVSTAPAISMKKHKKHRVWNVMKNINNDNHNKMETGQKVKRNKCDSIIASPCFSLFTFWPGNNFCVKVVFHFLGLKAEASSFVFLGSLYMPSDNSNPVISGVPIISTIGLMAKMISKGACKYLFLQISWVSWVSKSKSPAWGP